MARTATIVRETSESKVELSLNLDGTGKTDIDTSVPFYNHTMTALGKHSLIDLTIKATGDTDIDGATADVDRDIEWTQIEQFHIVIRILNDKLARIAAQTVAGFGQHVPSRLG